MDENIHALFQQFEKKTKIPKDHVQKILYYF